MLHPILKGRPGVQKASAAVAGQGSVNIGAQRHTCRSKGLHPQFTVSIGAMKHTGSRSDNPVPEPQTGQDSGGRKQTPQWQGGRVKCISGNKAQAAVGSPSSVSPGASAHCEPSVMPLCTLLSPTSGANESHPRGLWHPSPPVQYAPDGFF